MTIIQRPDHFTIVTDDLPVTEDFYSSILDFSKGPRPDFKIPGIWLYIEDKPILHVIKVEDMPNPRRGVLDHMAYRGSDINKLLQRLKSANLTYRILRTPSPWEQWQVFFQDPNGVDVEVDFDGSEIIAPENEA